MLANHILTWPPYYNNQVKNSALNNHIAKLSKWRNIKPKIFKIITNYKITARVRHIVSNLK
jgi:hypothetical protein